MENIRIFALLLATYVVVHPYTTLLRRIFKNACTGEFHVVRT